MAQHKKFTRQIEKILCDGWGEFRQLAMALAISSVLPSAAYSQTSVAEEAATSEPAFGDIVVTAQKRSESINKVGMSIGAFDGEALIDKGIGSPADLVKIVPGFSFAKSPRSAPVYTLRGVGFFDDALAGAPTVSVYVDQVPLPFSQMAVGASLDLERVEVLKGPQGTVFGSNATGGAINYIAAKPTNDLAIGGDVSFGRFNAIEASAFVSGPLSSTLKGRVVFKVERGDAWQVSQSRPDDRLGKRDRLFGRVLLDWQPSDGLRFALNVNGWRDRSDTQAAQYVQTNFVVPPFGAPELMGLQRPPRDNRVADWDNGQEFDVNNKFFQASLRVDYDVSDSLALTSISSYSNFKLRSTSDIDGTSYLNMRFTQSGKIHSYFQELRADLRPIDEITIQFGGNYQNDRVTDSGYNLTNVSSITAVLGNGFADARTVNETRIKTIAVFGNVEFRLSPQFKILGGVRYTDAKNDTATCTYDGGLGGFALVQSFVLGVSIPPGDCITSVNGIPGVSSYKIYEDNISWRAGLNWQVTPDILLYANVSRGYKAGGVPLLAAFDASQLTPVTQESVLAYEAGAKMTLLNNTLQLNGAVFYYKYTDKQLKSRVTVPPFGNLESIVNIPRSRVQGVELQITWQPTVGLTLTGGGTYIDTQIAKNTSGFDGFGNQVDLGGQRFPLTPDWQLTGDVEYDRPLNDHVNAFLGASATYQSRTNSLLGNISYLEIDPYAIVDLRFGIRQRDDKWRLSAFVRNLTDKYYVLLTTPLADTSFALTGAPRTYGLMASFRY